MGFSSDGINVAPTAGGQATISDSTPENNKNAIVFATTNSSGAIGGVVSNTTVTHNSGIGVSAVAGAGHPGLGLIIEWPVAPFNSTSVSTNGANVVLGGLYGRWQRNWRQPDEWRHRFVIQEQLDQLERRTAAKLECEFRTEDKCTLDNCAASSVWLRFRMIRRVEQASPRPVGVDRRKDLDLVDVADPFGDVYVCEDGH